MTNLQINKIKTILVTVRWIYVEKADVSIGVNMLYVCERKKVREGYNANWMKRMPALSELNTWWDFRIGVVELKNKFEELTRIRLGGDCNEYTGEK